MLKQETLQSVIDMITKKHNEKDVVDIDEENDNYADTGYFTYVSKPWYLLSVDIQLHMHIYS